MAMSQTRYFFLFLAIGLAAAGIVTGLVFHVESKVMAWSVLILSAVSLLLVTTDKTTTLVSESSLTAKILTMIFISIVITGAISIHMMSHL